MNTRRKAFYKNLIRLLPCGRLSQELNGGVAGQRYPWKNSSKEMPPLLRQAAAEGCVLLKNDGILPLQPTTTLSVFGRVQLDYFYVGHGSGGDVRRPYQINLLDGLRSCPQLKINDQMASQYEQWCANASKQPRKGVWGLWPRHYPEMPVSTADVYHAASQSDTALVVLGRSTGESRNAAPKPGSYYLTRRERQLLERVTTHFRRVIVVVNSGSIIDMSWLSAYGDKIGAVLLAWQGGMESGSAIADVLTGRVNPCGRLTDTIAKRYEDYPSARDFGNLLHNNYTEDIFVGYRYFETFCPNAVQFPFGFGLSYTTFTMSMLRAVKRGGRLEFLVQVKNTGRLPGKEVAQVYAATPQGKLGKPKRVLVAFAKTRLLDPGETQTLTLKTPLKAFAAFDDSGKSGYPHAFVLELGNYQFFLGANVRDAKAVLEINIPETMLLERLEPVIPLNATTNFLWLAAWGTGSGIRESVPFARFSLAGRILNRLPRTYPFTGRNDITLDQVQRGEHTLREFVAQLSDEELETLSRGYGTMDSPLGSKGNAGVFGGVTEDLQRRGIPPVTAVDGPSGIRLNCSCSLLPCATALACTWDTALLEQLHRQLGSEVKANGAGMLLSPGMNIHRNPLCGRNFEYYSEDPLLTGKLAAATVRGLQSQGVAACPKHMACNQQEYNRNFNDFRVSQRALREIYLRGFEIYVKESQPIAVMSSYNKINGIWSHYNYDLFTTVLRGEWGFTGMVLTDWWMHDAKSPEFTNVRNDAYRIRAQVDLLMPGGKTYLSLNADADNSVSQSLHTVNGLTRGELQRSAYNILGCILRLGLAAGPNPKPSAAEQAQTPPDSYDR